MVFVQLAISIALDARSVLEAEQLSLHQRRVFGPVVSDSTMHRMLAAFDEDMFAALSRARARARRVVWTLLTLRPNGFPWMSVAGKRLDKWVIVDVDATIITSASKKDGAGATFKKTKATGLHNLPSKSWTINRSWMAAANTAADLDAWLRLLTLHDQDDLAEAEPQTMRLRIYHQPARLARHARRRYLRLDPSWPWTDAFVLAWNRLTALPQTT
uniref:Transposase n=1 Tax=Streptomyces sp. NBC_00180 TaxID=2903632 RepID=A0AAU1IDC6_9ACTN